MKLIKSIYIKKNISCSNIKIEIDSSNKLTIQQCFILYYKIKIKLY